MARLVAGTKRMACLKLKLLVLVGLCSVWADGDLDRKRKIEKLFKGALGQDSKMEF
jgi:hypothetical protein